MDLASAAFANRAAQRSRNASATTSKVLACWSLAVARRRSSSKTGSDPLPNQREPISGFLARLQRDLAVGAQCPSGRVKRFGGVPGDQHEAFVAPVRQPECQAGDERVKIVLPATGSSGLSALNEAISEVDAARLPSRNPSDVARTVLAPKGNAGATRGNIWRCRPVSPSVAPNFKNINRLGCLYLYLSYQVASCGSDQNCC